jgi:tRNA U34 5-carboxymethylaminomethyl modifying GTPase MnmE/TrmE
MDLTEVEGLADLLAADTTAQRRQVGGGAEGQAGGFAGRRKGPEMRKLFDSLREV